MVLQHVTKKFDVIKAVDSLQLEVEEGAFFTLLGPSGCGKTTTLRMIAGFVQPDEGEIWIGHERVTYMAPEKRKVGMVFQNYALFPHMNVYENVAYGLKLRKHTKQEIRQRVQKYLRMVELEGYENRRISELSGGQQQRVALARSLALEPRVLLLDEPLSNLDAKLRETMRAELKTLQKELGITTIYVTHDQTEALTMSDVIAVFHKGVCQQVGSPRELYDKPVNAFVAGFIGETNLFPVQKDDGGYTIENRIHLKVNNAHKGAYASIRPTSIVLSKDARQVPNEWEGVIKWEQFYGSHMTFIVDVKGIQFKVQKPHTTGYDDGLEIGRTIFLSVDPTAILLVPEN